MCLYLYFTRLFDKPLCVDYIEIEVEIKNKSDTNQNLRKKLYFTN